MTRPSRDLALLFSSELFASVVGFGVLITLARRLGPGRFADYEYAAAVLGWWLVVVRGGFDSIVYREAARRPRLVRPLTDLLIGLRLASTLVAYLAVLGFAGASGGDRGWVVATMGLALIPSALAVDVGFRASGRFAPLALAQAIRALGLAAGAVWMVGEAGSPAVAAGLVVAAEAGSSAMLLVLASREQGGFRPRFRRRAWIVLARRGAVAGLARFARVGLYAADLLILGALASADLGPFAAARRVAFALLALGLVAPSAVAPRIARAWASSSGEARSILARTFELALGIALPATVGLMATADRWMPALFGEVFRDGGPWLALVAARLPFVLASNLQQAALVACRREGDSLRLVGGMAALALVALPAPGLLARGLGRRPGHPGDRGRRGLRRLAVAPEARRGPALASLERTQPGGLRGPDGGLPRRPRLAPAGGGRGGGRRPRTGPPADGRPVARILDRSTGDHADPGRRADVMTIDEPGYFDRLAQAEAGHWWPRAMWRLASDWLEGAIRGRRGLAGLDVGCGAGLSLIRLAGLKEIGQVVGLEPDPEALRLARRHRGFEVVEGSALALPFPDRSFDVVTCCDVFQHLPVGGDRVAALEIARVLRPGGVAVVRSNSAGFGPGFHQGGSAYRLGELAGVLAGAGLVVARASYANSLPALAQEARGRLRGLAGERGREWRPHPSGGGLRLRAPRPWINRMMGRISTIERQATTRLGMRLPFGHSTMVLASRTGGTR